MKKATVADDMLSPHDEVLKDAVEAFQVGVLKLPVEEQRDIASTFRRMVNAAPGGRLNGHVLALIAGIDARVGISEGYDCDGCGQSFPTDELHRKHFTHRKGKSVCRT